MKTTTLKEIDETTGGNITPDFYFEWGNEPSGYVSTGLYIDDEWFSTGFIAKEEALRAGLRYRCPYN